VCDTRLRPSRVADHPQHTRMGELISRAEVLCWAGRDAFAESQVSQRVSLQ